MAETLSEQVAQPAPLPHSGMGVAEFYSMHLLGALFPTTAGLLLYGWRAAAVLAILCFTATLATAVWREIGPRGQQLRYPHALWYATLLALMLPAQLATTLLSARGEQPWPIIPVAGLLLVVLLWLLGGLGAGRIHPVLVTYLFLIVCFGDLLVPHWVLQRDHLLAGDLFKARPRELRQVHKEPWIGRPRSAEHSEYLEPAAEKLSYYTSGHEAPDRGWLPLQGLLRDSLPPLEDLIVGGQPGPVGASSAVAVIIGGLFLFYRGLIDFRIPLIIILATFVTLLILPIPIRITNHPEWRWLALRAPAVGWATAVTFVNYEMMASPLMFMAFFLATSPSIRPMSRRGRVIYAIAAGALCALFQLYTSVAWGPYLALLLASLLTPGLDKWFRPRPLV